MTLKIIINLPQKQTPKIQKTSKSAKPVFPRTLTTLIFFLKMGTSIRNDSFAALSVSNINNIPTRYPVM